MVEPWPIFENTNGQRPLDVQTRHGGQRQQELDLVVLNPAQQAEGEGSRE